MGGTSARLKTTGNFRYKEKEIGGTVYGIDPEDEAFVTGVEGAVISGGEFLSRLIAERLFWAGRSQEVLMP